ncbi:MAG: rod shape-determining protein [Clostridia bacterium]|jgi:rod shape-determining protein MreB|nr:rod shape-determining protein [Clostridia bacterium]
MAVKQPFSFKLRIYKDIGIDLGSANSLVFMKGRGIVLSEPSVVAVNERTGDILAVGNEAKKMIGRTPGNIIAIRPLRNGVIADFNITKVMLKYLISKAMKGFTIAKPRVLIGIPLGITQVEKRAVLEAAYQAGAKEAYLIEEPVASAVGAGLPVAEPRGSLVVDIGGGTSEVALISLGGVVVGKSLRVGGDELDQVILRYIRKRYNLDIGIRSAEQAKIDIGYAIDPPEDASAFIKGRNLASGLPNSVNVTAREICEILSEPLASILEAIKSTLERTPPELASDIIDNGMMLTGGGALLKNIDKYLLHHTKMPVLIADDPLTCMARGTGRALEEITLLRKLAVI